MGHMNTLIRLGWLGVLVLASAAPVLSQPAVPPLSGRVVDLADILSSTTEESSSAWSGVTEPNSTRTPRSSAWGMNRRTATMG